jgi:hypothetical protein
MEFKYDVRDLKFILKEWLPTGRSGLRPLQGKLFMDDIDMLLNEGYKVAGKSSIPSTRRATRSA